MRNCVHARFAWLVCVLDLTLWPVAALSTVVLAKVEALLDHKNLDKDVAWFRDSARVSTTENVCVCIWETILHFDPAFAPLLQRVEVHETENNIFAYEGPQ